MNNIPADRTYDHLKSMIGIDMASIKDWMDALSLVFDKEKGPELSPHNKQYLKDDVIPALKRDIGSMNDCLERLEWLIDNE